MRIKIVQKPNVERIDGVRLDLFEVGCEYEVGHLMAAVLIAEQWAEPVAWDAPALTPFDESRPEGRPDHPPNLTRERWPPPYYDGPPAQAMDRQHPLRKKRLL